MKMASKLFRMKYAKEIRDFVMGLPFENLVESQTGDYVYVGNGTIKTGMSEFPVTVRIVRTVEGGMEVNVKSTKAGLNVQMPFNTKEDRCRARESGSKISYACLN